MTDSPVHYAVSDGIATVTINRPRYRNAQNSAMTYGIDTTFQRAVDDDVRVVVLNGAGDHFSAGHDIGTPERDAAGSSRAGQPCSRHTSARPAQATKKTGSTYLSTLDLDLDVGEW